MSIKLTEDVVTSIRLARLSGMSLLAIAAEFDVDVSTVSRRCADIPRPAGVRPGRPRKVEYSRMAQLHAKGMDIDSIADRFGLGRWTVHNALKACGWTPSGRRKVTPAMAAEIRLAWGEGVPAGDLADLFGVSETTVRNYVKGVSGGQKQGRPRTFDYSKAAKLRAYGLTLPIIANRLGVHVDSVRAAIRAEAAE